ncbi:hypothetical protein EAS62_28930 [Bradyrhizobium zhanjiangense]|uniref:Secreted protein n=1 Tax=Bradyrhizobium zhanjiangense TaxID=1325107 RepID=A0ABY0DFP6_9BRAD|nr:hypothetical protein EAS62_28930 [Bradyrhizobium zhanjiangense]
MMTINSMRLCLSPILQMVLSIDASQAGAKAPPWKKRRLGRMPSRGDLSNGIDEGKAASVGGPFQRECATVKRAVCYIVTQAV